MKTTTLSIVITLALSSENVLVYAHQGGLSAQTGKNPSNKLIYPVHNTHNSTSQPVTTDNSSELPAANKTNTASSDNSLNLVTNDADPEQPCKFPRHSNKKLINSGINPVDIQNFSSSQLAQLTAEQIGAFNAENFADLLLGTVIGLTSNLLSNANKPALAGFNATQVTTIPPQAFKGFTHNNLGGLTPAAIQAITSEQLNEIVSTEFQTMPEKDVSKLLANLNPEHDIGKIQSCLPGGWEIKPNKGLNRPAGAPITLRPHHHNKLIAGLDMAEVPDLSVGFGLGGSIDENDNVLTGINETIAATQFQFTAEQTEEGIIKIQDENGTELAFLPDSDNMIQGIDNAKPTIETNQAGQYLLTLKGGQQIPVNPSLKDPQGLLENLAPQSTLQVNKQGHARFYLAQEQRTVMCAFSPWVNKAPMGSKPGIKVTGQPGVNEQMVVVYEDGHAQEARPAIQSPETFKNFALAFTGVENVSLLVDGRIKINYYGNPLVLIPAFDIKPAQTEPCSCSCSEEEIAAEEETVEPNVEFNEDGSLTFTNEAGDEQQIFVIADDSEAVTEASNKDNTLPDGGDSDEVTEASNSDNTPLDESDSEAVTEASNKDNTLPDEGDSEAVIKPEEDDNSSEVDNSSSEKPSTTVTTAIDLTNTTATDTTTDESNSYSDNTLPAEDNSSEVDNFGSEVKPSTTTTAINLPDTTITTTENSSHSDNKLPETDNSNSEVKPSTTVTTTTNLPDTTVTTTATESNNSDNPLPETDNSNNEVKPDIMEITEISLPNTNESVSESDESNISEAVDETEEPNEANTTTESSNSDNSLPDADNSNNNEVKPDIMEITEISLPNTNESVSEPDESNISEAVDETEEPNEANTTTESSNSDNLLPEVDNSNDEVEPDIMEMTELFNQSL